MSTLTAPALPMAPPLRLLSIQVGALALATGTAALVHARAPGAGS